jgi:hypothetical protein
MVLGFLLVCPVLDFWFSWCYSSRHGKDEWSSTTQQEIDMRVKSDDVELVLDIMSQIGEDYQSELEVASLDGSLYDFLEQMESYGYWGTHEWF